MIVYAYNTILNVETASYWTFPQYLHNIYLDHSHNKPFITKHTTNSEDYVSLSGSAVQIEL